MTRLDTVSDHPDIAALEREAARLRAEALAAGLAAAGRWLARLVSGRAGLGGRTA